MRGDEQRPAGRFIRPARLDPHQPVLDEVDPPNPVLCRNIIQHIEYLHRAELLPVHRYRRATFEADFHFFGLLRRFVRRNDPLPHRLIRSVGRIFQLAAFVAQVPDVAVAAVNVLLRLLDGHVVRLRVGDGVFPRMDRPFAPGRDDPQARRDGFVGQLEAHLVVALARAAVREAVRAELERELRLPLRQHRPRHRSAQQILVLIDGSGAQRRPDVLAHKLFAQIFDVRR